MLLERDRGPARDRHRPRANDIVCLTVPFEASQLERVHLVLLGLEDRISYYDGRGAKSSRSLVPRHNLEHVLWVFCLVDCVAPVFSLFAFRMVRLIVRLAMIFSSKLPARFAVVLYVATAALQSSFHHTVVLPREGSLPRY